MSNKLVLKGDLIFESMRFFYDKEHQFPMETFDPLAGSIITFKKGATVVTLKEALEVLPDPFKIVGEAIVREDKTEPVRIEEVEPARISWLVYAQFLYKGQAVEISISDLSMSLFYDESCKHVVPWIQIQFPKREIANNSTFAIKISLIKSMEYLAWSFGVQGIENFDKTKAIIESDPDWMAFKKKLSEKEVRAWNTKLPDIRFFHMKICGCAREND
jgi:hypothetical protein